MSEKQKSRVTVVHKVYHQTAGEQPTAVECQFERPLLGDDQPYQHRTKFTEEWRGLGESWIERCSIVSIKNQEGRWTDVNPTLQERAVAERKVVEVGFVGSDGEVAAKMLVKPGESLSFSPVDFKSVRVRCRHGMASCVVSIYPE